MTRLARLAAVSGCHGVVESFREAAWLREALPAGMLIVLPEWRSHSVKSMPSARAALQAVTYSFIRPTNSMKG